MRGGPVLDGAVGAARREPNSPTNTNPTPTNATTPHAVTLGRAPPGTHHLIIGLGKTLLATSSDAICIQILGFKLRVDDAAGRYRSSRHRMPY